MWRQMTKDDVLAGMHSYEAGAYEAEALRQGQENPFETVIAQVSLEVREAIRSCSHNKLSADPAHIPEGAVHHAAAIVRHRLQTRFSDEHEAREDRRMEYRSAMKYLEDIAACKRAVEDPGGEDLPAPVAGPRIAARKRLFTRRQQQGI